MAQLHRCGTCSAEFNTEKKYLDHVCNTGFQPTDFRHQVALDPNYAKISEAALARGAAKGKPAVGANPAKAATPKPVTPAADPNETVI